MALTDLGSELSLMASRVTPPHLTAEENSPARYVHPSSRKLFKMCGGKMSYIRYIPMYGEAIECYGLKLVFALNTIEFCTKGLSNGFLSVSYFQMFAMRYEADVAENTRFSSIARTGWSIKPFTALLSDAFAVWGYKKRWYLTFSSLLSAGTCLGFAFLPPSHKWIQLGAIFAFLAGFGQANIDILVEGLYARKIREHAHAGPYLVSSIWAIQQIANLISSVIQGVLNDMEKPHYSPMIAAICVLVTLPLFALNWLEEMTNRAERREDARLLSQAQEEAREEVPEPPVGNNLTQDEDNLKKGHFEDLYYNDNEGIQRYDNLDDEEQYVIPTYCSGAVEFNKEVMVRNWRITLFCFVITGVVVSSVIVSSVNDGWPLLLVLLLGTAILTFMNFWAFPWVVAKASFYNFIPSNFSASEAYQSFFLASSRCNPGGPNFSNSFFYTANGLIGCIGSLAGVTAFSYLFSKRSYRFTFYVLCTVSIISGVFDLIMIMKWNIAIGIPYKFFYIFGDCIIGNVVYMLNWMPMMILLAQLCPRGSESMMYSLLAAMMNFSQSVTGQFGTLVLRYVWPVKASALPCDFSNLWKILVTSSFAIPLVNYLLIYLLIPDSRICDPLVHDEQVKQTERVDDAEPLHDEEEEGKPRTRQA